MAAKSVPLCLDTFLTVSILTAFNKKVTLLSHHICQPPGNGRSFNSETTRIMIKGLGWGPSTPLVWKQCCYSAAHQHFGLERTPYNWPDNSDSSPTHNTKNTGCNRSASLFNNGSYGQINIIMNLSIIITETRSYWRSAATFVQVVMWWYGREREIKVSVSWKF